MEKMSEMFQKINYIVDDFQETLEDVKDTLDEIESKFDTMRARLVFILFWIVYFPSF